MTLFECEDEFFDAPGLENGVCFVGEGCEIEGEVGSVVVKSVLPDADAIRGVIRLVADIFADLAGIVVIVVSCLEAIGEGESKSIRCVPVCA